MNTRHFLNDQDTLHIGAQLHPSDSQAIADHKWFLSERLGRDVGTKVAALDYLENVRKVKPAEVHWPEKGLISWFLKTLERLAATRGIQNLALAHHPRQTAPFGAGFEEPETFGRREQARAA